MTPLMMLALTLPPSIAFVLERWMAGREAQARKLADDQALRVDVLEEQVRGLTKACEMLNNTQRTHTEQLSKLADRYR